MNAFILTQKCAKEDGSKKLPRGSLTVIQPPVQSSDNLQAHVQYYATRTLPHTEITNANAFCASYLRLLELKQRTAKRCQEKAKLIKIVTAMEKPIFILSHAVQKT